MGRKSHNKDRDYSEIEKYKSREKRYKKEIARLRKIVQKLQDEHEMKSILELVEVQAKEDKALYGASEKVAESVLKQWKCHSCNSGIMLLTIINRLDGVFYYRRCHECGHKTRMKKYHNEVKGIKKEDIKEL